MNVRDGLTEFGYAAGWRLVRALPAGAAAKLFRAGADRAFHRRGRGVTQLARNLRRVVGPDLPEAELDILVRDGVRAYARYWLEAFRLPTWSRARILRTFRLHGESMLADAMAAGKGAVLALPHMGNWDHAGAWVAAKGWPLTAVAERLRPDGLYRRFMEYRESIGMKIVPLSGGTRPPIDVLEERLRAGDSVALLADRDLSARGVDVTFFGATARMPAGPALLALRTGAPLFVASLWAERTGNRAWIEGPLPVPDPEAGPLDERVARLTQQIADMMARRIAERPSDWHMLQRLWLDDRSKERARAAAPDG